MAGFGSPSPSAAGDRVVMILWRNGVGQVELKVNDLSALSCYGV